MTNLSSWKAIFLSCVFCAATAIASRAQTFTTLVNFDGANGVQPMSMTLIQGTDGNFYGTTYEGGAYGMGTVFKVTAEGVLTTLYSFCAQTGCPDGKLPYSGLVQASDGNFYGITSQGGAHNDGTVFKITPEGTLTTLHTFNGADGSNPNAPLIQASNGNFYGTTSNGGGSNACNGPGCGTIFEITPAGQFSTLHTFDGADGWIPSGLIQASNGNFYGTAARGGVDSAACPTGPGCGTVFGMTPVGELTTLYSFHGGDGSSPYGALVQGTDGNFYGTTAWGGASNNGTVFEITPEGELTTLYSFNFTGGAFPTAALIQATDGNLYGTTTAGGLYGWSPDCGICSGDGTLFEITSEGELTTLHNFDMTDGAQPWGGLVQATDGNFYGTTALDGTSSSGNCFFGGLACGTVFSLSVGLDPFVKTAPSSGEVGAAIMILGTELTDASKVTFNGTAAKFTVFSSSEIRATVPVGASSGKVEVATPHGALSSNVPFQVGVQRVRHGPPFHPHPAL
jgi:uncharacterized repeat protein (TIGR03803 family)